MGVFIDPWTDWGFKHIFGREASKDVLINFLNSLLEGERVITDVHYMNNEREPEQMEMRKIVYDIYCKTDTGEHIIVEMQNRWQEHFSDRALFYMSESIVKQAQKGNKWNFNLTAVYGIFFVNFTIDKKDTEHFCKDIALIDKRTGKVFSKKFRQIYIEIPRFRKEKADCDNFFEYWIYNLVNMKELNEISFKDKDAIFGRLEQIASQANLSKEERAQYEYEWKVYNDYFNTLESGEKKARAEGLEKGMAEGLEKGMAEGLEKGMEKGAEQKNLENARKMKEKGISFDVIADITGLSVEAIRLL